MLAMVLFVLWLPSTGTAATLSVGPGQPYATLDAALGAAADGDVIELDPGVYVGPWTLNVNGALTIVGLGGAGSTFLTAPNGPTILSASTNVDLQGLDISADSGSVLDLGDYSTDLEDVRIANTTGASAIVMLGGRLTLSNSIFEDNSSPTNGGVVNGGSALVVASNSQFIGNSSGGSGGAIHTDNNWQADNLDIDDCTFMDNNATDAGGAVYGPAGSIANSIFQNNVAGGEGGAVYGFTYDPYLPYAIYLLVGIDVSGSYFEGNTGVDGGAVANAYGVSSSQFVDNTATGRGGAVYAMTPAVSGSIFVRNSAGGSGGSVYAYPNVGSFVPGGAISSSTFRDSTSGGDGGGVYGAITITTSRFEGNTSTLDGGGALGVNTVANFASNSFIGNDAGGLGGGLYVENEVGPAWGAVEFSTMTDNYFCDNGAAWGAGAMLGGVDTSFTIGDNVFADNRGEGLAIDIVGSFSGLPVLDQNSGSNTFVANEASGLTNPLSSGDVLNNVFADHATVAHDGAVQAVGNNLWWNNVTDSTNPALPSINAIFADPQFTNFSDDGDCYNDDFTVGQGPVGAGGWTDSDGDGVPNNARIDNCPGVANPTQLDTDGDGIGDACDPCPTTILGDIFGAGCPNQDTDGDGVIDTLDPCPLDPLDDSDGDGSCDTDDLCQGFDDTLDADADGVPDGCDPCPLDPDDDSDGDGSCDTDDLCQGFDDTLDADADGVPDGCDPCPLDPDDDSDGDGVCDSLDLCDGEDDLADADGDGHPDACDTCPSDPTPVQTDADGDGYGSPCDCNDGDPAVFEATGVEVCDGIDNDCDTRVDEQACDTDDANDKETEPGCGGCDASGGTSPLWIFWLALVAARRRTA